MAYDLHLDISISIPCSSGAGGRGRWEREGLVKREKRGYTFFLVGFVYTEDKKTRKISGFYFYFYSTRPFCPPPPVQNQKCNLFVSKDKIHSPTRKFLPPYPTLHTTTPQTVHIHRYTLSQLHETERRHLETNRIFNQPTLTSNFPLGLFFFFFFI